MSSLLGTAMAAGLMANICLYNAGNSTFNLQPFQAQTYYSVQDSSNNQGSRNYTYFFNICGNIDPSILPGSVNPDAPSPLRYCNITYPGGTAPVNPLTGPAPAFQYANFPVPTYDYCHRLGARADTPTVQYGLYDTDNPSRGLFIKYLNGDLCLQAGHGRSLKVWILCDTDVTNIPDTELIEETSMCDYEIFIRSAFGCPAECPVTIDPLSGQRSLCSNHGICDYDGALGTSRCFCNQGWEGRDCSAQTQPPPALSAVSAVLIAVGIFLALTLGFLGYLWMRIRSLRLDPTAYSALRSGPDGEIDNTIQ